MRTPRRGALDAHGPRPARVPYVAGRALWTAATIGRVARRIATRSRLGKSSLAVLRHHTGFQLPRKGDGAGSRTPVLSLQSEHPIAPPTPSLTRERPVTVSRPVPPAHSGTVISSDSWRERTRGRPGHGALSCLTRAAAGLPRPGSDLL